MRAYYHDNIAYDSRLPHDSNRPVAPETIKSIGILHWSIPVDDKGDWAGEIDKVSVQRQYANRDVIEASRQSLGDSFEEMMNKFATEHMHDDEEIRYCLAGSAFFDVREHSTEQWIRIHVDQGDLLVLPAGIYHRFSLDENDSVKMMRLFKDEPKWTAYNRNEDTDQKPRRLEYLQYLQTIQATA